MDLGIAGKSAFVSGAHRGTGAVIARMLAEEGACVFAHGPRAGDADDTVSSLRADGFVANAVAGDLTTDDGVQDALSHVVAGGKDIDILVNNWGGVAPGRWSAADATTWHADYERNVLSMVRLSSALCGSMKAQGWGRIISLGTQGTVQPPARTPHYYAAKAALAAASASLARELGPFGITVNLVSPGLIRTAEVEAHFRRRAAAKGWGDDWAAIEARALDEMGGQNPSGRMSTREEVAAAVVFLAGAPAGHISGVNLRVDGAASALSL